MTKKMPMKQRQQSEVSQACCHKDVLLTRKDDKPFLNTPHVLFDIFSLERHSLFRKEGLGFKFTSFIFTSASAASSLMFMHVAVTKDEKTASHSNPSFTHRNISIIPECTSSSWGHF